jgi:hypothetical protein
MTTPMFSINAASEILEKDRRTITKALRHVQPDGFDGKDKRYRLKSIIDALARMQGGDSGHGGNSPALAALNARYDQAEAAMAALATVKKRRDAARALLPLIVEIDKATRQVGLANGQNSDMVHLRADQMLRLITRGIEQPTGWTYDQLWEMISEASDT